MLTSKKIKQPSHQIIQNFIINVEKAIKELEDSFSEQNTNDKNRNFFERAFATVSDKINKSKLTNFINRLKLEINRVNYLSYQPMEPKSLGYHLGNILVETQQFWNSWNEKDIFDNKIKIFYSKINAQCCSVVVNLVRYHNVSHNAFIVLDDNLFEKDKTPKSKLTTSIMKNKQFETGYKTAIACINYVKDEIDKRITDTDKQIKLLQEDLSNISQKELLEKIKALQSEHDHTATIDRYVRGECEKCLGNFHHTKCLKSDVPVYVVTEKDQQKRDIILKQIEEINLELEKKKQSVEGSVSENKLNDLMKSLNMLKNKYQELREISDSYIHSSDKGKMYAIDKITSYFKNNMVDFFCYAQEVNKPVLIQYLIKYYQDPVAILHKFVTPLHQRLREGFEDSFLEIITHCIDNESIDDCYSLFFMSALPLQKHRTFMDEKLLTILVSTFGFSASHENNSKILTAFKELFLNVKDDIFLFPKLQVAFQEVRKYKTEPTTLLTMFSNHLPKCYAKNIYSLIDLPLISEIPPPSNPELIAPLISEIPPPSNPELIAPLISEIPPPSNPELILTKLILSEVINQEIPPEVFEAYHRPPFIEYEQEAPNESLIVFEAEPIEYPQYPNENTAFFDKPKPSKAEKNIEIVNDDKNGKMEIAEEDIDQLSITGEQLDTLDRLKIPTTKPEKTSEPKKVKVPQMN